MPPRGRSFYVLDDVPFLYQANEAVMSEDAHLFKPKDPYRMGGGRGFGGRGGGAAGENPPGGAVINYWLKNRPQGEVTLEFLDSKGASVKKFSSRAPDPATAAVPPPSRMTIRSASMPDPSGFPRSRA